MTVTVCVNNCPRLHTTLIIQLVKFVDYMELMGI